MSRAFLCATILSAAVFGAGTRAGAQPAQHAGPPIVAPSPGPGGLPILTAPLARADESPRALRARAQGRRLVAAGMAVPGLAVLVTGIVVQATRPPECDDCFIDADLFWRDTIGIGAILVGSALTISGALLLGTASRLDERAARSERAARVLPFAAVVRQGGLVGVQLALR